jgi:ribonuclease G
VRQLRLRDIGGIIVIDFIDMSNPKNRETVEEALRLELERDRTKTYVVEISPLGLVEMTRQNVTDGPREILTNRCPVCDGDGVVVSDATHALEIERRLRSIAKGSRVQAFKVAVHPRVLALLAGPGGSRLAAVEAASRRRFFLVPAAGNGHAHLDHFEVLAQGKLDAMRPAAPVDEGASIELKLVEVGLYDPTAGVGKLAGGYEVTVAGAAKLVGKKVTASVGCVLEGSAYATLADAAVAPVTPITFEAEADKPTRAARTKKDVAAIDDVADVVVATEEPDEATEEIDAETPETPQPDPGAGTAPKKKRTRRGTRGGRARKKPAAATAASEADADDDHETNGRPSPRIHVPPPDLSAPAEAVVVEAVEAPVDAAVEASDASPGGDEDGAPPKRKRSRRGSRGGKKRRKPAAVVDEETASVDARNVAEVAVDGDVPEYVPMSEWIDDFETRSRA